MSVGRSRYNTCRSARLTETPIKVITVTSHHETELEPLAASSVEAQTKFLEGVGLVTTKVEPLEEVLDAQTAEVLSCALSHKRIRKNPFQLTDPYFTDEQWEVVLETQTDLMDEAEGLLDSFSPEELPTMQQQRGKEWVSKTRQVPLCNCKAHLSEGKFFIDIVVPLLPLQAPLNDNTGNVSASILLRYLLKLANLSRFEVRGTHGGSMASVQYILWLPSGTEYLYTGWPNFQIFHKLSQEERRLASPLDEEERVHSLSTSSEQLGNQVVYSCAQVISNMEH